MISQDQNQFIFFANNEGLLEYNGSNWQLYPSPNETIIRSVKVIGDKIYTGSYMEFGFWNRNSNGLLSYTSLSKPIENRILKEEQFWNILNYDQWVIFQSLNRIYIYDTKIGSFKILAPSNEIIKSFRTPHSIYFQISNQGLFEIDSGKSKLVSNEPILKRNRIVNLFAQGDDLLVLTQNQGFYKLLGGNLVKFNTEADSKIMQSSVYSCELLSEGNIAIGTVSNGIIILNEEGKIKHQISQANGLSNNTVLSLFEDKESNLWVGLDNGINCINLKSPIQSYIDDSGVLGTVYCSELYKGKLYIGTNQGLFYKNYQSNESFHFINGTKGQVWSLYLYDDTLFCGHDKGTFIINNDKALNIFSSTGTWNFRAVPNHKDLILQGNYYGISVLEKKNNQWQFRNKIKGFDYSSKYFEINANDAIYVSHEYKGVFRLLFDKDLFAINAFTTYKYPGKGKNSCLIKFNNAIYYSYKEGVFKLNNKTKQFNKDKLLSSVFENDLFTSGKMIVDNSNKLWLFSKNHINYYAANKLNNKLSKSSIPIPVSLTNSMLGYENITQLSNSIYFFGTTDGYYLLNINNLYNDDYQVSISKIVTNVLDETVHIDDVLKLGVFKHDENNITISYTVPEYNKYINTEYQYILEGFQDKWTDWHTESSANFKNLSPGDYVFKLRAKYANSDIKNTEIYSFTILRPWYKTNLAIAFYILLFFILNHFVIKKYNTYHKRQKEKLIEENNLLLEFKELENEKQMMYIKNEQLSQDVNVINRELAASTMSLNSKNELLAFIKEDLKKTSESESRSIKSVISTINKNISKDDSWNVFQEAFDHTDKDFLKKLKEAHPSLTPNDLRLCAYLRLNLSSKEIAPLLNISVRSVEIKRYRLRKKIDLSHQQGLVEYILAV
ncbi:LuxR family transcriptional regulator [Flavobacterium cellulosilyticum]|uniref:LuxR family transcriptional regulator n=2 Tax=Flavobacterium cellulosilyticum TaxID=2541731 RepID=A0A4R5C783_9FLAO|nr:LuxR family transcriptional regulator [Flavobacterium cellulosilyticum]